MRLVLLQTAYSVNGCPLGFWWCVLLIFHSSYVELRPFWLSRAQASQPQSGYYDPFYTSKPRPPPRREHHVYRFAGLENKWFV